MNDLVKSEDTVESALLRVVKDPNIDPDRLEKFLELQIKMEDRQAAKEFHSDMAKFRVKCPQIPKSKKVDFKTAKGSVKYDYAPLDEIDFIIKPLLGEFGFSYAFNTIDNGATTTVETVVSHKSGHIEKYTYTYDSIHDDGRMNLAQRRKSALTFAKRAGLENAFGLVVVGDDDDAKRAHDNPITEEQRDKIKELLGKTKSTEESFLSYMNVESLDDLSSYDAKRAINVLKQKREVVVDKNLKKG